jgi:hypothetical protein
LLGPQGRIVQETFAVETLFECIITTSKAFVNLIGRVSLSLIFIIGDTGSQSRTSSCDDKGTHRHVLFSVGREGTVEWRMDPFELILLRGNHILHYGIGRFGQLVWSLFQ